MDGKMPSRHVRRVVTALSAVIVLQTSLVLANSPPHVHVSTCEIGSSVKGVDRGSVEHEPGCSIAGGPGGLPSDPSNGPKYYRDMGCYKQAFPGVSQCIPYLCCDVGAGYFASIRLYIVETCEAYYKCVGKCCDANRGASVNVVSPPPGCSPTLFQQALECI